MRSSLRSRPFLLRSCLALAARKAAGQLGPGNYRATVAIIDVLHDYAAATAKGG
jgi:hypothetical protein